MRTKRLSKTKRQLRRLKNVGQDNSAVAMVEFAFAAPLVLGLGLLGTETAYYTITHMQISQIAMQVADSASRVGEADVLLAKKIYEDDINGALVGAEKLGAKYDIYGRGRIILSSLQLNNNDGQWIAWQRCRGAKNVKSSYGIEGDGETGTDFPGMGKPGSLITASSGSAVMFVEVSYTYESITPFEFFENTDLKYTAAFNVRDNRDLTRLYQTNPVSPVASCNTFSAARPS